MEKQFNIKQVHIEHVQLEGVAFYDQSTPSGKENTQQSDKQTTFAFAPDDPVPGRVPRFRRNGVGEQMTDGTFQFVAKPQKKSGATSIKELAHGRASRTKDEAVLLYLKVFVYEGLDISQTIQEEADAAVAAIRDYQLNNKL